MAFITEELDYHDQVKNKYSGVVGQVIAIYMNHIDGMDKTYLDVRTDRRVHNNTPAINWELVGKNND